MGEQRSLWIMIAGPYTSGASDEDARKANLRTLNQAALAVFEKGHIPIIGVNLALPVVEQAGQERFDELMMPISLAVSDRCDACLRISGPSQGADQEVERFKARGLPVYFSIEDVPAV